MQDGDLLWQTLALCVITLYTAGIKLEDIFQVNLLYNQVSGYS
jgi:hypothetical protein